MGDFSFVLVILIFLSPFLFWGQKLKKTAVLNLFTVILFVLSWRYALNFKGETGEVSPIVVVWIALFIISLVFFMSSYALVIKRKFNISKKTLAIIISISMFIGLIIVSLIDPNNFLSTVEILVKYFVFTYVVLLMFYGLKIGDKSPYVS